MNDLRVSVGSRGARSVSWVHFRRSPGSGYWKHKVAETLGFNSHIILLSCLAPPKLETTPQLPHPQTSSTFFRRISTFFRFSRHFPQCQQLQKGTTHNAFVTCRAPSAARSAAPPRVRSTAAPCRRGCRPAPSGMHPGSEPSSKPWNGDRRPGRAMGKSMGINMEFIWILYL